MLEEAAGGQAPDGLWEAVRPLNKTWVNKGYPYLALGLVSDEPNTPN